MGIRNSKLARSLLNLFPLCNTILLESIPDLSDNTKAVFDEMIRRGLNKKYKFVWIISGHSNDLPEIENVSYVQYHDRRKDLLRITSRYLICCNQWIQKVRKGQTAFYLSHGTPLKSVREIYCMPEGIDYCLAASQDVIPICEREFNAPREKIYGLGFPRNDVLTEKQYDLHPLFPDRDFDKVIVWYPTYRQKHNGITVSQNAIPILNDPRKGEILNECARQNRVLLVLKPHFAQNTSYIRQLNLSNILFIDDSFFTKHNISSYGFVGSCDALITDYSSIYFDYTLCDKPIALIWEDYEEYKKSQGFIENVESYVTGAERLYTLEELEAFVQDVAVDRDRLKEERARICNLVNHSTDGKNTARVVDFIIQKAGLTV